MKETCVNCKYFMKIKWEGSVCTLNHEYKKRRHATVVLLNIKLNRRAYGVSSGYLKPLGFLTEKLPLQALAKWREHVTDVQNHSSTLKTSDVTSFSPFINR